MPIITSRPEDPALTREIKSLEEHIGCVMGVVSLDIGLPHPIR